MVSTTRAPLLMRLAILLALLIATAAAVAAPDATTASMHTHHSVPVKTSAWLDEGIKARATLTDWDDGSTFCFYENATLRIRLDPLNSTQQPYVVRTFGQSDEAHALYAFLVRNLSRLQAYAWPFRSFFWAWSDLRAVVTSAKHDELIFAYQRSAGMLCRGMLVASTKAPELAAWIPEDAVAHVQHALQFLSKTLCENCVHGCVRECVPLSSTTCIVQLSPYHAPCLTALTPPKPFLSSVRPSIDFNVEFQTVLSPLFLQNFFVGLLLFYSSERLARSRTFHYTLGVSLGICFSALLALYFFTRQTRAAAKMVPGAQFVQSVGSLLTFAVPFTSFVLLPSLYRFVAWGLAYLAWLWSADEVLGVPHLGKIYFFFFGFLGFLVVWWNQWGASPKIDDAADVSHADSALDDELGLLDDDDLPLTTSQLALARLLKAAGIAFLFYSTSSTEISLVLILLVSLTRLFQFLATSFYFWYHYERAGRHSVLISKKEFEQQAVSATERALQELQGYLRDNPDELDRVSEDNEIRLRRFMKGRNHLDVATRDSALKARQRGNKSILSYCSIQ